MAGVRGEDSALLPVIHPRPLWNLWGDGKLKVKQPPLPLKPVCLLRSDRIPQPRRLYRVCVSRTSCLELELCRLGQISLKLHEGKIQRHVIHSHMGLLVASRRPEQHFQPCGGRRAAAGAGVPTNARHLIAAPSSQAANVTSPPPG